ncbi:MAG: hypothetical protein MI864_19370 [Pseudomonadales bacterium]|nr:hypothetical protein [Pseudomonadales bacterium]
MAMLEPVSVAPIDPADPGKFKDIELVVPVAWLSKSSVLTPVKLLANSPKAESALGVDASGTELELLRSSPKNMIGAELTVVARKVVATADKIRFIIEYPLVLKPLWLIGLLDQVVGGKRLLVYVTRMSK